MKITATTAELQAITEALKLAAVIDDRVPKPDKARVVAWAERIHSHNLTESDLLGAVEVFYDEPRERAVGVGDLIHHGKQMRRERAEREADEDLEARQARLESKALTDDDRKARPDTVVRHVRPEPNPRLVRCPHCRAGFGKPCTAGLNFRRTAPLELSPGLYHSSRLDAAHQEDRVRRSTWPSEARHEAA